MGQYWDDQRGDVVTMSNIILTDADSSKPNGSDNHGLPISPAEMRALTNSVLIDRLQLARQAGISFGGARDEYEILGYDRIITSKQFRDEYARGGIAGRIVDALPNATWRGSMEIVEDEDPKHNTSFEQAWKDLDTRLQIQAKFLRVDKLAGLSTFAVLLIGAPGDLETELPKGKPDDLAYLTPFSGGGGPAGSSRSRVESMDSDCTVAEYEVDPANPRFGLPLFYRLKRTDFVTPQLSRPIHWTRILHIAENLLDDEVHGQPTLERVWNLLTDLRKVTGGGAEAFWLRANQGLHVNVDKTMSNTDAAFAIERLKEQSLLYKHQIDRWLRTKGTDVEVLGSDVANFESPADAILTQIAGARGIPKRILTGSEMGELASSQDRDNWKDQVNGRQTGYAGPYIVRPFVDRLIRYGYLPTPAKGPMAYEVRWPHIQTLTAQEKVEGAKGWASVNSTQGSVVFTDEEIRDRWEGMPPLTDEQREEIAKRKAEAAAAEQPPPIEAPTTTEGKDEKVLPFKPRAARHGVDYKFSSTQVQLPDYVAESLLALAARIPDEDLAEEGREDDAHVTVCYGLHTNDVEQVRSALSKAKGPIELTFGKTAIFDAEEYDVLYVEVHSPDLHALNQALRSLPVTNSYSEYTPHATVAYLKKGLGDKYTYDYSLYGLKATVDSVRFSPAEGDDRDVQLRTAAYSDDRLDEALIQTLQQAIEHDVPEVIDAILGIRRQQDRMLGGPGSGNFGHKGRPGHVGGSAGDEGVVDWKALPEPDRSDVLRVKTEIQSRLAHPEYDDTDFMALIREAQEKGSIVAYHGTASAAIDRILEEGLVPRKGIGADAWARENVGDRIRSVNLMDATIAGRKVSVFVTSDPHEARRFSSFASEVNPGSQGVVLEIKIPATEVSKLKLDELSNNLRFEGRIPPEWIKVRGGRNRAAQSVDDGSLTLYFAFIASPELETLGGPGSGNHGHQGGKGGKGNRGGSTSKAEHAPTESTAAKSETPHLDEFTWASPSDLPDGVMEFSGRTPLSRSARLGVEDGLAEIKRVDPEFYERMKSTKLIEGDYEPKSAIGTAIVPQQPGEKRSWILLQSNPTGIEPENVRTVVQAAAQGQEDYVRAVYRGAIIHEAGHILDGVTARGSKELMLAVSSQKDLLFQMFDMSQYAALGGPREAFAELYTAHVLNHKIPSGLRELQRKAISSAQKGLTDAS